MAEDFNNNNINRPAGAVMQDPNRPRLKKVKRPIKRIINPASGTPNPSAVPPKAEPVFNQAQMQHPTQPQAQAQAQAQPQPKAQDDFDLDAILDGGENLPAINNAQEVTNDFQPQFIEESDITPPKVPLAEQFMVDNMFTKKALLLGSLFAFIIGFGLARLFFAQETVVRDGLQGVVINPEVPRGRARCGVAERTQGCVLYIMNPQRQELTVRDFYDLASQLTGRQRFVIETGNMRYSNVKIAPGEIGQFNIPPLQ